VILRLGFDKLLNYSFLLFYIKGKKMNERNKASKLKIDFEDLIKAMEDSSFEISYYLNVEDGRIVSVTDKSRALLAQIYETAESEDCRAEDYDLDSLLGKLDLEHWEKESLKDANDVENNFCDSFVSIPQNDCNEDYQMMCEFVKTVPEAGIKVLLSEALELRHPRRKFRAVLAIHPDLKCSWDQFKIGRQRARALEWLQDEGIEST
jgi:hypothetical protein